MSDFFKIVETPRVGEGFEKVIGNFESLLEGVTSARDSFREGVLGGWEMGVVKNRLEETLKAISDFHKANK